MKIRLAVLCVLAWIGACRATPEPEPQLSIEVMLDRGRAMSRAKEHTQTYIDVWREIRDQVTEPHHKAEALYRIAMAESGRKNLIEYDRLLWEVVDLDVESDHKTMAFYYIAGRQKLRGNKTAALKAYEEYISRPPVGSTLRRSAMHSFGMLLAQTGENERAKEALRQYFAEYPNYNRQTKSMHLSAQAKLKELEGEDQSNR